MGMQRACQMNGNMPRWINKDEVHGPFLSLFSVCCLKIWYRMMMLSVISCYNAFIGEYLYLLLAQRSSQAPEVHFGVITRVLYIIMDASCGIFLANRLLMILSFWLDNMAYSCSWCLVILLYRFLSLSIKSEIFSTCVWRSLHTIYGEKC